MNTDDMEHGIRWARAWLIIAVIASVAGNFANVALTESPVSLGVRLPGSIVWPLFLFGGIEVMVRNRHRRGPLAYLGRVLLLMVCVPTFITSYLNLNAFMVKSDEPWLATVSGPIAVDGLMLGCTIMLLAATIVTRVPDVQAATPNVPVDTPAVQDAPEDIPAPTPAKVLHIADEAQSYLDRLADELDSSTVPAVPIVAMSTATRVKPENVPAQARELIRAWLDTPKDDRPRPGDVDIMIGTHLGRNPRTARGWRDVVSAE